MNTSSWLLGAVLALGAAEVSALTQSNAGFTTDGNVTIAHTGNDAVSIQPGVSPLAHPADGDFADLGVLLDYAFVEVSTGTIEQHVLFDTGLSQTPGAAQLLADAELDTILTLVLLDADPGVAATYAGYTNFTLAGPTLTLTASAVPIPAALPMLLSGLGLVIVRRRGR